ncbi:chalcone isomerase family protein [Leptothrix discophora]|uniref:Chalcone isomerase family protein n=1 Tax=Leptothrix discophora TaxID=89 RepID=A0ABT9G780_LEPDI|nr:chalcone isomerase family protein [Leptothrix discophora]MDP4302246.1 chalcone isomerase family protein [Leptothrix discophora]
MKTIGQISPSRSAGSTGSTRSVRTAARRRVLARLGGLGGLALLSVATGGLTVATPAQASNSPPRPASPTSAPAEILEALPDVRLQGGMRFTWFGLHVYDARLWTVTPLREGDDLVSRPYALELAYARRLEGRSIADRSLDEMKRLEAIGASEAQDWLKAMRIAFPDVAPGDRLVGLHRPGRGVQFLHNGRVSGEVADTRFARLFFGIWLSASTREPALRAQLLGAGTTTR